MDEGESRQYTVVAQISDGTTVDASSSARWFTSDDSVLSVDQSGVVKAWATGNANLTAEVSGIVSGALTVEVFVPFTTTDGVVLRGRFFGNGDTTVILAHMFPADQTSWYPFAGEVADAGYAALTFDFRGYGVSEGERVISEIDKDLQAAVALARSKGGQRAFLVGASMGGTASLKVAAREKVSGVVAISAPEEFRGLDALADVLNVVEPKLFVAAEGDRGAAISARNLYQKASDPKELAILSGSAHGTHIFSSAEAEQLKTLVLDFLQAHRNN